MLVQGTLEVSKVTGRLEPTYPVWKRNVFRYLVSVPVIGLCLACVFVVMLLNLKLQVSVSRCLCTKVVGSVHVGSYSILCLNSETLFLA